jgi:hypothetical protein
MQARFKSRVAHRAHVGGSAPTDVRARPQQTIHQGTKSVVRDDGGSHHLGKKAAAKDSLDRPAGVIGADAEKKTGLGAVRLQDIAQPRHTVARAAQRVDIDFEGNHQLPSSDLASAKAPA